MFRTKLNLVGSDKLKHIMTLHPSGSDLWCWTEDLIWDTFLDSNPGNFAHVLFNFTQNE